MPEQEPKKSEAQQWRLEYLRRRPSLRNGTSLIGNIQANAAELTSHLTWRGKEQQPSVDGLSREDLENKLADIVIPVIDLANLRGINLEAVVKRRIIEDVSSKPVEEKPQNI